MAEFDSKRNRLISVVRVLELHGTEAWITATLKASRIPPQGEVHQVEGRPLPEGCSIKSGLVVWMIEEEPGQESRPMIPIPPGSTTVQ
jgi:hypothetical protein